MSTAAELPTGLDGGQSKELPEAYRTLIADGQAHGVIGRPGSRQANAYRDAELIRGEGDAIATRIYAEAFNRDPEFYSFTRSLRAYQQSFKGNGDIMLIQPDSEFFRYLNDSRGGKSGQTSPTEVN